MKLYIARHGQTPWNAMNKVCGLTDLELTDKGIEQAYELAKLVSEKKIDIIITSPLKRAIQTGEIVSKVCKIPTVIDERIIEQNYGVYEGVDRKDKNYLAAKKHFAYKYPNGESMMQVAYRVYGFIDNVKQKYAGKNVLVICHGGVCRVLNTYFNDVTNDEFFHYSIENAQLAEYDLTQF